jgi:hypothetical protein
MGERSVLIKDIVVPVVSAVVGSGLLVFLLNRPVVASEQVRACEERHQLQRAKGDIRELSLTRAEQRSGVYAKTSISSCEWPPPVYANQDGFSQIVLVSQQGPGQYEATSATALDRYTGDCRSLSVAYSTGTQGDFSHGRPFVISRGAIVDAWEGEPWPLPGSPLGAGDIQPYPGRDEFIVVRNSKIAPDVARIHCAS